MSNVNNTPEQECLPTPEELDQMQWERKFDNNWLYGSNSDPDTQPSKHLQVIKNDDGECLVGRKIFEETDEVYTTGAVIDSFSQLEKNNSFSGCGSAPEEQDPFGKYRKKIRDIIDSNLGRKKVKDPEAHWDARLKAQAMKTVKRRKTNKQARKARRNK